MRQVTARELYEETVKELERHPPSPLPDGWQGAFAGEQFTFRWMFSLGCGGGSIYLGEERDGGIVTEIRSIDDYTVTRGWIRIAWWRLKDRYWCWRHG